MRHIIVAMDKNRAIGASKGLPWAPGEQRADMRHFKDLTMGHAIIMGRVTYDSIGRPLPERHSIVMTSDPSTITPADDVSVVTSVDQAFAFAESGDHRYVGHDVFVIGGAAVYAATLPFVDTLHVTEIDTEYDHADTYFPAIDTSIWVETSRQTHNADAANRHGYSFVIYRRSDSQVK